MGTMRRAAAAVVLGLGLAGLARAQTGAPNLPPVQPHNGLDAPPVFPRVADAIKAPHQPVPVPATMEIEVLDPNVDARGNPAVVTRPGPAGGVMVDIPPTVLVHRYYYTGDRSFQAGLLTGGPCIAVVSHPKTGERLYIPLQLPPGAPRVTYTANSIEYDYYTQAVTITFCGLLCCGPKVTYRQGVPLTRKVADAAACTCDSTRRLVERTGIPDCADKVATGAKNVVVTTVDRTNSAVKLVLGPPTALIRATPLGNLFTESPEDQAAKDRNSMVERARDQAIRQENSFINTNR